MHAGRRRLNRDIRLRSHRRDERERLRKEDDCTGNSGTGVHSRTGICELFHLRKVGIELHGLTILQGHNDGRFRIGVKRLVPEPGGET